MFPTTFQRRDSGSDASNRSMMDSSNYASSSKDSMAGNSLPSLDHHNTSVESRFETPRESILLDPHPQESVNTCTTSISSFDDSEDESLPHYDYGHFSKRPQPEPATPQEFAELFPSVKRLFIRHDESALDGNMNIRIDTDAKGRYVTLFHLRMYDIRDRDFSFRRYGRDCGREVAHIKRKMVKNSSQRPALKHSVTKALHSIRGKHDQQADIKKIQRQDSGYASGLDDDDEEEDMEAAAPPSSPYLRVNNRSTNICTLEFSNYAHVNLVRRGARSSKRYEFEYWGKNYTWKRSIKTVGLSEDVSYLLVNNATNNVVAFIRCDPIGPADAAADEARGDIIPRCSMWLKSSPQDPLDSDHADVADVIVTTGLVALVDDCIKRKYHQKRTVHLVLPITGTKSPIKMNMDFWMKMLSRPCLLGQ